MGWCIESRCLEATAERIVPGGMLVLPDTSRVQAVAANGAGDIAVGIVEWAENEAGSPVFEDFYSMVRSRAGAWRVANDTVVPQFSGQTAPGLFACGLVYWDSRLFVAQYQDCPPPCGVFGQLFSEPLQAGPLETIDSMWLRLGIDSKKRIVVAHEEWNESEYKFHLYVERRDALPGQPPSWTSLLAQPMVIDNFQFLVVGGRTLILVFDDSARTLPLHWLDPEEIGDSMHMPCLESYPAVGTFSDPAGEGFVLAADCSETSWSVVTWRPQPPPPNRWTVGTPQAMSSVTVVSGASKPMIAALVSNADGYDDAVIRWHEPGETWEPGTGQRRTVLASRGLTYVHSVIGTADSTGAPIIVVGTSQASSDPDPADFTLVRFHP